MYAAGFNLINRFDICQVEIRVLRLQQQLSGFQTDTCGVLAQYCAAVSVGFVAGA